MHLESHSQHLFFLSNKWAQIRHHELFPNVIILNVEITKSLNPENPENPEILAPFLELVLPLRSYWLTEMRGKGLS